jgi:DNA-binding transcriptional LysR family regulator
MRKNNGRILTVNCQTTVHDLTSQIDLAVRGLGIVSVPSAMVKDRIDRGVLSRVLPSWSSPMEALYIYFPSRRHQSAALRALVAFLKSRASDSPVLLKRRAM